MSTRISVLPFHSSRRLVVLTNVSHELALQVRDGSEYTPGDDVALDLAKPQLDLVQPRGVSRSEVQVNLRMLRQKVLDWLALVSREVVGDHVDLLAARLVYDDVGEECDELSRCVPRRSLAKYFSGLRVESGIQRQGAVAKILEAMPFCASWGQRQRWILAIQRLDRCLFIHAEHRSMRRRVQIQP